MFGKCLCCKKKFWKRETKRKFCSRPCANLFNKGPNHPQWIGRPKKWNRLRVAAVRAVSKAIKRGTLIRKPCQVCGLGKSEAHHKDYTKRFEVEWLCRRHHRDADWRDGTRFDRPGYDPKKIKTT